jgi:WXG100 family type VII secretion target
MSAPKIRADYEGLQKIAQSFEAESGHIAAATKSVKTIVDALRGGDWVGPGAMAFYQEMDSAIFPGLNRLSAALGDAAQAAARVNGLMMGPT